MYVYPSIIASKKQYLGYHTLHLQSLEQIDIFFLQFRNFKEMICCVYFHSARGVRFFLLLLLIFAISSYYFLLSNTQALMNRSFLLLKNDFGKKNGNIAFTLHPILKEITHEYWPDLDFPLYDTQRGTSGGVKSTAALHRLCLTMTQH